MRIASIQLKNFKRFTDLTIREIPATAKLVVVVGPNGCGKSSLFDALIQWYRLKASLPWYSNDLSYYCKEPQLLFTWDNSVSVVLHDNAQPKKGCLYVCTAYRNDPDFSISGFNRQEVPSEKLTVNRVIDNDQTVSSNYQRLLYETMASVYDTANDEKTVLALREELIGQVRMSMQHVFGDLLLNNISDPLGTGAFFFEKGAVKSYHYKNLSGGEKAAFDLLLDLHVKKKFFADAIYCIDEADTHLHTRAQGPLVRELVEILPENSQLWVTTHSLGVLRTAQDMVASSPGTVCIIDFDGVEPDVPHELVPSTLGRVSWEKLLSIALDDLSERIAPNFVVVCEGSSVGTRRREFDAEIYNRVLGSHTPEVLFVSGGSSTEVGVTRISIREVMSKISPKSKILALVDRDDKSDIEVAALEKDAHIVLSKRNLESFLFADDVIKALVMRENKLELLEKAMEIKTTAIADSVARGNPSDDLKSAAGEIFTNLKKLLNLQRCGGNTDSFMRDTLAPLITQDMPTYHALKKASIDRILKQ